MSCLRRIICDEECFGKDLLTAEYEWGGGQEEEALQQEAESMFLQKFTASSSAVDGDQAGGWCESFLRPLIPDCWE